MNKFKLTMEICSMLWLWLGCYFDILICIDSASIIECGISIMILFGLCLIQSCLWLDIFAELKHGKKE